MGWTIGLAAVVPALSALEVVVGRTHRRLATTHSPLRADVHLTHAVAGTLLVLAPALAAVSLTALLLTVFAARHRPSWGDDAADQMARVVIVAGAAAALVGTELAAVAFLWFVTLQACVAYTTAGVCKLCSAEWRRGTAVSQVLSTDAFGRRMWAAFLRRHDRMFRAASALVILYECSFSLVLVGELRVTAVFLIAGVVFHLASAFAMRLNTFFWGFMSTYPAIAFCAMT